MHSSFPWFNSHELISLSLLYRKEHFLYKSNKRIKEKKISLNYIIVCTALLLFLSFNLSISIYNVATLTTFNELVSFIVRLVRRRALRYFLLIYVSNYVMIPNDHLLLINSLCLLCRERYFFAKDICNINNTRNKIYKALHFYCYKIF